MVATIRAVGVERVTLGTDFGQKVNPHPAAGLQTYADALFAEGLTEAEIRTHGVHNPSRLLGLDADEQEHPCRASTFPTARPTPRSGCGRCGPRWAWRRAR